MDLVDAYRQGRERVLGLAADLDERQAAMVVPACPAWTVKDVYAHMAGVPADVLAGRLEGVATDEWTGRQVAARADRSLDEVCAELAGSASAFEDVLVAVGDAMDPRLFIDQWTHEQDVRGALDRPGARDVAVVGWAVDKMLGGFGHGWNDRGLPTLRVLGTDGEWLLGAGSPAVKLRANDFELVRALVGRRSLDQYLAYEWEGDPKAVINHLHAFPLADSDLVE